MDSVCTKCGTLGWENELKNWHERKTGCAGRIIPFVKGPEVVPEPVRAGPVKAVITGTGDGAAEVSDVPQGGDSGADRTPNRRTREAYNAYQREYMRKRRAN